MGKEKQEKIAAIVVTYNRKQFLGECLGALLNQTRPLNVIYIIDNASTDGTPEYLVDKGFIDIQLYPDNSPLEETKIIPLLQFSDKTVEVHYIRMHENTGGAGGFYEGVKRAYKGYDWLWLMDDDVKADARCLEHLLEKKDLIEKQLLDAPVALACARFKLDNEFAGMDFEKLNLNNPFRSVYYSAIQNNDLNKEFLQIECITFEGLFLNTKHVKHIGLPDKRFFIYADDIDYCIRLLNLGKFYYIPSARLTRLVSPQKRSENKYMWKSYFEIKNIIYLDLQYAGFQTKFIRIPYYLLRYITGRLYYLRIKDIAIIFNAVFDAIKMYREKYNYFE